MNAGMTLSRYIGRQYLLWFAVFLGGLAGIIFLFEIAELFRRAAEVPSATFGIILQMAVYKMPNTIARVLPFVILFAAMFTFWRLTRSHELIVARAAGISAWQFLMPAIIVTLVFSLINIAILNPIGATMTARYDEMDSRYLQRAPTLELTGAGLWLRQTETTAEGTRNYLLHADRAEMNPLTLLPVIIFIYDEANAYMGRIDALSAVLDHQNWVVKSAWLNSDGKPPQQQELINIKTSLTLEKIQESMAPPATISFWELPSFARALKSIGLPDTRHRLRFQSLLAEPFLLCAMVLFAAAFALRLTRQGGMIKTIIGGLFTGSIIFSLNNVVLALGANQTLPVVLAAWAIPLATLAAGKAALLYLEDG